MSLLAAILLFLANATGQRTIDYWIVSEGEAFDSEIVVLVERSTIFTRPDGWTTYSTVTVLNGSRHTAYKSDRESSWVNCRTREHVRELTLSYGDDGKLILQKQWTEPRRVVTPGSVTDKVVGFVCGNTAGATQLPGGTNPVDAADAVYARKHPQVAKAPVPRNAPASPSAAAPAARGKPDYWMVASLADSSIMTFVDKASIARRSDGKMGFAVDMVFNNDPSAALFKQHAVLDCSQRTYRVLDAIAYGKDGRSLGAVKPGPELQIPPNTPNADMLAFVCQGEEDRAIQVEAGYSTVKYARLLQQSAEKLAASVQGPKPRAVAPRSPAAAPAKAQAVKNVPVPGLGENSWKIISLDSEAMVMYAPSSVKSGKASGQAWFTVIYAKPRVLGEVKGVVTTQLLYAADCARNTKRGLQAATYDANDRLIFSGAVPNAQPTNTQAGTVGRTEVDIACGRPAKHLVDDTYEYDVPNMRGIYASYLALNP